jgi:hypothetical protein
MHLCSTDFFYFYDVFYVFSNPRVHLHEAGCMCRYGVVRLHAEITIKGLYKVSKYKVLKLLIQRYKHKTKQLNLII